MTDDAGSLNAAATEQAQLSEAEAAELAEELKAQLRQGRMPASDAEQINRMVAGLGDRRGLLRLTFAESLGTVGPAAVPALCTAMCGHDSVIVRRAAAKTLTLIADPASLPSLVEALLNDADPVVQGSAVGAMAALGADAVQALLDVLIRPESSAMQLGLASWGLAFVGARAPEALRQAARSEHAEIRTAAIAALGDQIQSLGDAEATDLLTAALEDGCMDVRAEAATLLGKLHDAQWAQPLLTPRLKDQEAQVRKNAALSLMKLGSANAVPALQAALDDESDSGCTAVFNLALRQLGADG